MKIADIRNIYNHLQDEISKFLFEKRLLYNFTGDKKYLEDILFSIAWKREELLDLFHKQKGKNLVFWGAGRDLKIFQDICPEVSIEMICDKSKEKQANGYKGIEVIPPNEVIKIDNVCIVVTSSVYHKDIISELKEMGIESEKIIDLGEILLEMHNKLDNNQYFEEGIIEPVENEIFVDGGCYNCATDLLFRDWCKNKYKKIYAFEPDDENYKECVLSEKENEISNIEIINAGVWSENTILSFNANHDQGSSIGKNSNNSVSIVTKTIDSVVGNDKVTFIKLDVEGAELEALKGAKETIIKNRPRLAICIYHKLEDIYEIPAYILSLHSDYKLYIRHYQLTENETIVYAV